MRLHDPLVEPECAIADEMSGPRELAAVLFHARPMHWVSRRVCEQPQEVGRRVRELDLERVVVDRAHADPFRRQTPRGDLIRVLDRAQDERVDRERLRIGRAPKAVDEVVRGDGIAVRPASAPPQREHIRLAVLAHGPRLCCGGLRVAVRRLAHEPFVEIAEHVRARHVLVAGRIERLNLGTVTEVQHLVRREHAAGRPTDCDGRAVAPRVTARNRGRRGRNDRDR